ncbi:16S rRNA (adenine(1518)-N(6)/adenine(1519)-N(6))-dimethyltransferase RsmA [Methanimicrococcus blatticola]|uniref:Probable ribosomal RNA small subunit methyltransferase A n=1 Tax=Methanimicrococcus blatticola TaxID=91560 RepID=A0A484F674_9EURY|nr:16S rRNA (adenine(1518)-N(6)/adenine(1519)-N(6))-dimethyltransferase RsmA [Methanimicrococcus blatticola]MBZ3935499.1 ribosomal RNA small subunit methyltransferase A [Methanimicrococcus blatticola]MCC2509142.1 16S rRNA (adenine(1518)-N(6)/adenine(1519)-N(6))-dimethyltransferase RsmA [Methanimicrococcus blatticola]TDQ69492.1 dimethyladenosine transferase [Methanimicrococcus blatticola]
MVYQILKEYGVKGGKMDQHFLTDAAALDEIVDAAQLEPSDIVLEIGGGIGNLSERIAPRVSKLIIIELDPQMVSVLKSRLSVYENIEIIQGNVMDIDLSNLPFNKIVANLPYSISSDITLKFLKHDFDLAVLMYQYEFAQRLTAEPGGKEYGRLSVHVQYKTDASLILKVPKESFEPAPKVDSAVILLKPRPAAYSVDDEIFFFSVTKALFSQRRKKIKNTLLGSPLKTEMPNLKDILETMYEQPFANDAVSESLQDKTVGDILSMRAEELSPADIAHFSNMLYRQKS